LMVAFHYPPCGVSSGLQRTLAFTRYLPKYGWDPALVTVTPGAFEQQSDAQLDAIPTDMPISRAFAGDAARHFSIAGRYPSFLAVPDRWASWRFAGVRAAVKLARQFKPDVIWSTFPIPTAHRIAAQLQRRSGLPWVADMRDPMVEFEPISGIWYPTNEAIRRARQTIEQEVNRRASAVVFCTDGARQIYADRYADGNSQLLEIVSNGYDEPSFAGIDTATSQSSDPEVFRLLHSGTVYPGSDRGPDALFDAIGQLDREGALPGGFRLVLRATGHDSYLSELIDAAGMQRWVELLPAIPYQDALREMSEAEALLVLQGHSSNPAIPAKVYEYLRAGRQIIGLVHPDGNTAALLQQHDIALTASLDDAAAIRVVLKQAVERHAANAVPVMPQDELRQYCREEQTGKLASVLQAAVQSQRNS